MCRGPARPEKPQLRLGFQELRLAKIQARAFRLEPAGLGLGSGLSRGFWLHKSVYSSLHHLNKCSIVSEERKRLADPQFPTLSHSLNRSRWGCRRRFLGAADVKWHFHTSPFSTFRYRNWVRCARALSSLLS